MKAIRTQQTIHYGHRTLQIWVLCLFVLFASQAVWAQNKPKADQKTKVYLDHADVLSHHQMTNPDVVVVKGKVKFRVNGMTLNCDSAHLNEQRGEFDAFGQVRVRRPDGVSLDCDRAYYDGSAQMLRARKDVLVRQPGKMLKCDSLDYNLRSDVANYFGGRGTLVVGANTIMADQGDYNTKTKDFHFNGNVVMLSRTGKIREVHTPAANGNMDNGDVHVTGTSTLRMSDGGTIHTTEGYFNQITGSARTVGHATITSPTRDIDGTDISFNNHTGESEGHGGVTINDKANRRIIKGQDVRYNSNTGYMQGDGNVDIVDNLNQRTITGNHVVYQANQGDMRGYGKVVVVDKRTQRTIKGDTLIYNEKTHDGEAHGNVDYIDEHSKNAFQAAHCYYTDEAALAYGGKPGPLAKDFSQGMDTLYVHADTVRMRAYNVNTDSVYRYLYGVDNVRAYRTDVQAICGLLVTNTKDSCATLYDDPILWNGNRQLLGDSIRAFMNDSTIREAFVYGNAMSVELMSDNEHYNQVSSKWMHGVFEEGKIRRGDAVGNVLAIYYPIDDKDSTMIGLVYIETDTMRMYLSPERRLEKIWMPKTTGVLYPMTQIPADKRFLPHFAWFADLRPVDKDDVFRRVSKADNQKLMYRMRALPPRQRIQTE